MNFKDTKKTRAVVNLDNIAYNYNLAKKDSDSNNVIAVVKADAYGHGAVKVAKRLQKEGCTFFAVSSINEALELREAGINDSILILGYVLDDYLEDAIRENISLAVDNFEHIEKICEVSGGRLVKIHIKLDTGMNRTGFAVKDEAYPKELKKAVDFIKNNKNIVCEGVFSHFSVADEDSGEEFTLLQYEKYCKSVNAMEKDGLYPKIKHICNSGGITNYGKKMHLDAVRLGIQMYCGNEKYTKYKQCMDFITTVVSVHDVKKGESVSYGRKFVAEKDMRVAVIGAGYADGLTRSLSCGRGYVLCHGKKARFLGRICMDMAIVDVTDINDVMTGDDVVIFGENEGNMLYVYEHSRLADTISYESLCSVSKRVPRIYIGE